MTENKKDFNFGQVVDWFKETSVNSKDYYKFIVGLSTGTLIFSITFFKEFLKLPQFRFVVVIGWGCLFLSVVIGVWLLSKIDILYGKINQLKYMLLKPEEIERSRCKDEKEIEKYYLKGFMKKLFDSNPGFGEEWKAEIYNKLDRLPLEFSRNVFKALFKLPDKKVTKSDQFSDDLLKEAFNFFPIFKHLMGSVYLPNLIRNYRRDILKLYYGEKGMKYFFYFGLFVIGVFAAINFLY